MGMDLWQYIVDLFDHWAAFMTGGIPVAILAIWERWRGRNVSFRFYVVVFLVFGFVAASFQTWREENKARLLAEQTSTSSKYNANRWEPLSADETLALRSEFRSLPKEKLSVLCAFAGCTDLADSIFTVVNDLSWTGFFEGGYMTDGGIRQGIEIWSYSTKRTSREVVLNSIERATKGRLKISSHEWEGNPSPEITDN